MAPDGPTVPPSGPAAAPHDPAQRYASHLRITRSCTIPMAELSWRYTTSGGPGGQHANRSQTRAEVSFDIAASPALGPRQRARLIERLGPTVRAAASDERSQLRNRELALQRLRAKLADGLRVEPARRPTAPTRGSTERRLDSKRRQGARKADRRASQSLEE